VILNRGDTSQIIFITGTIDYLFNEGTGGVSKLLVNLCNRLTYDFSNRKISIFSCFEGDSISQFKLYENVEHFYLQSRHKHNSELHITKKIYFWIYVSTLLLKKLLTLKKNNILISCTPAISIFLILTKKIHRQKIYIWENVGFERYGTFATKIKKYLYKFSDLYISPTDAENKFLNNNNIKSVKIANTNFSHPEHLFKKSNPTNPFKLLAIGRLVEQKGFTILMRVLANLDTFFKDWDLTLIGSGPERAVIEKIAQKSQISNKINFVNHSYNLEDYYLSADCFLLSSIYEGSPLVLIEAQSFGIPCIAFDCPTGPREIIDNKINGFLINPGNISDMAKKIHFLYKNPNEFLRMSESARISSFNFTEERIITEWKKIL
jgi:glycosyltransferase involved in cell wall biosynthesis